MVSRARERSAPRTKWGDREGRRRDILGAARRQIESVGYLQLNMRDVAAGAGVSPGTLYSYFATKEEIFATLYAEAIEQHNERIEPLCADATDLEQLLVELATAYLDLYEAYGRYFTQWSELQGEHARTDARLPRELSAALRDATIRQGRLLREGLERGATASGRTLTDDPVMLSFLWSALNGIGDHVTSERGQLTPFSSEQLIAFSARAIAAGITEPVR